jgi:hypothetical protein
MFRVSRYNLKTLALNTSNSVAVFVTDAQLNTRQPSILFQNRTSVQFSDSFTRTLTQHNH